MSSKIFSLSICNVPGLFEPTSGSTTLRDLPLFRRRRNSLSTPRKRSSLTDFFSRAAVAFNSRSSTSGIPRYLRPFPHNGERRKFRVNFIKRQPNLRAPPTARRLDAAHISANFRPARQIHSLSRLQRLQSNHLESLPLPSLFGIEFI